VNPHPQVVKARRSFDHCNSLARRLVAAGWKVAIIERKLFGGTRVNTGCTPILAMERVSRAKGRGETTGFMKILLDRDSSRYSAPPS